MKQNHLIKDKWLPFLFVLGFLVVIAVNGVMIGLAFDSFPGFADGYRQEAEP